MEGTIKVCINNIPYRNLTFTRLKRFLNTTNKYYCFIFGNSLCKQPDGDSITSSINPALANRQCLDEYPNKVNSFQKGEKDRGTKRFYITTFLEELRNLILRIIPFFSICVYKSLHFLPILEED